jgi:hypothetical protein
MTWVCKNIPLEQREAQHFHLAKAQGKKTITHKMRTKKIVIPQSHPLEQSNCNCPRILTQFQMKIFPH